MESSQGHGTQGQWKMAGENYIDSVQHRRHRFTEHNQRNDDHFLGGPSSKINSGMAGARGAWETSHSGHTTSQSRGYGHISSSNIFSPMADVEEPPRNPRGMYTRPGWIPRKKLVLDGPLHSTSYAHWNSQVFPSQHDNGANITLSR